MANSHSARAVVIGDISMVRALGRAGIPVVLASCDRDAPAARSRFCEDVVAVPSFVDDPDTAVDALIAWCAKEIVERNGVKPVIFCQGDHDLLAVSRRRADLERVAHVPLPPAELVDELVDKLRFAALAERTGLPVPPTLTLRRDDRAPPQWRHFPAVLKPATRSHWMDSALLESAHRSGVDGGKAIRLETRADLDRVLPIVKSHATDCVLQKAIDGGEDRIVSYHAYVRDDGTVLAELSGKKVRTTPRCYGYSTCVTIARDAEVLRVGRDVVSALQFTGVLKIDFKRDARDGRLYLLEINPRFNLWHHLFAVAGVNIPAMVFADCVEPGSAQAPVPGEIKESLVWMSRGDVRAFLEYRKAGEISVTQWLRELLAADVHEDLHWRDPLPLVGEVLARAQRSIESAQNVVDKVRRTLARAPL